MPVLGKYMNFTGRRKKMKKKLLAIVMALCLMFPATVYAQPADEGTAPSEEDTADEVVIYHTNDTHGYLSGDGSSVIGIDQVAGLKESTPGSILVDAGDATQGLPLASLTKGADVIELMNLAGYDLLTAGNHEFDFGTEQFLSNVDKAEFPILAANIYRNGQPLLAGTQGENNGCHTVIERGGVKIGFFGLTTVETATSTNPTGISDLEFRDEVETAKNEIDELEAEGVDAIVAVCHMGNTDAPCTSEDLANAMTGDYQGKIDVIIDAHSHTVENTKINGTFIVQTGSNMAGIGKLTLEISDEDVTATEELLSPADLSDVTPDAAVTERLAQIQDSQAGLLETTLGSTETTLWAGLIGGVVAVTRLVETNYGDLVTDAFRDAGETFMETAGGEDADLPVIAVENGGGIRAGVANGNITVGDLINAFPFSNTLYMKKVTPAVLYAAMELSGTALDGQDKETGMLLQGGNSGGFLQISGFTVVYDPDAEAGQRVTSITLDGQTTPLDRNDTTTEIIMVSNNYIMSGGSSYTMLGALPKYGEAGGELETIRSYVETCLANGTLQEYAGTQNRIQMRSLGYEPKDYSVSILITDESGQPLADQRLSYRVDGRIRQNGTTDENGMLTITLSDGAHGVRLADTQQEIYIDNYSGFGIFVDQYREQPVLTFLANGSCDPVPDGTEEPEKPGNPEGPGGSEGTGEPGEAQGKPDDSQGQGDPTENDQQKDNTAKNPQDNLSENKGETSAPQTGDDFSVTPVIMMIFCVAAAAGAVAVRKRK